MSLQVWLPLLEDEHNKGVNDSVPTVMGTVTYTAGKLGNAATFSGNAANCIHMPGLKQNDNFSWACWLKVNATTSNSYQFILSEGRDTGSHGVNLILYNSNKNLYFTCGQNGNYFSRSLKSPIDLDTWYHVAITISSSGCSWYLNGQLIGTADYIAPDYAQSNDKFVIGKMAYGYAGTSNYFPFNGQVCDVRIYDHCLSQKEVKELSKGLIGHWPLNDMVGGENLLSVTPRTHTATAYNAYQFNLSENLVAGQTYTIQLWDVNVSHASKSAADLGVDVYWGGGSVRLYWWHGTSYFTNGHADHLQATFTVTEANASGSGATNAWLNIYNSVGYVAADMSMTIGRWKLEKGSTATPWIPAPSDDLYSAMGLDEAKVYDTSGYGRNGYFGNSAFTTHDAVSDSPRYLVGTHLNSSNLNTYSDSTTADYIKIPFTLTSPDAFTIAVWANIENSYNSGGHGLFASTKNGTGDSTDYQKTLFNHRDNMVDVNSSDEASHIRPPMQITFSSWTHYAVTCDGLTAKTYKNGVLQGSASFSSKTALGSMVNFYIGLSLAGGVYRKILGDYSDFRFYATALSADDIKELYETAASVDNHGNMWGYELNDSLCANDTRELINFYNLRSAASTYTGKIEYTPDGIKLTDNIWVVQNGGEYRDIDPTNRKYVFQCEYSNTSGNQFYIGIERYDANKTSTNNNSCVYPIATTASLSHATYSGVVDLSKDVAGNTTKFIRLRILNRWTNSTSAVGSSIATIHNLSLKEIPT